MAQKHLQLLRNGTAFTGGYTEAYNKLIAKTDYADGTPILARYIDEQEHQKTLLGVVNNGTVDVINNVSDYLLRGYTAFTGDTPDVTASDDIKTAIAKLEKQIDNTSAAAATVVTEGTDTGNNMTIDVATDTTDNHKTYKINLTDVASKTALDAEIDARKKVDGVNGDAYTADTNSNYLAGATSLYDADSKLDAALKAAEDKHSYYISSVTPSSSAVKEEYALFDGNGQVKTGKTVKIYKDSSLVSITYITDSGDTHYQNLEYKYIDASGNPQTEYVDMSSLVLEAEFASGVTVTNHIAHGVVDNTSESFLTVGAGGFKLSGVQDAIDDAIEALDVTDTADENKYVSSVSETDGKITVSRTNLVNGKLSGYTKSSDASAVATGDTLGEAISKLENQIENTSAAAATVVAKGTSGDSQAHIDIVKTEDATDHHAIYTIDLNDVASASALTAETQARTTADNAINTRIDQLSGKTFTAVAMTGGMANTAATADGTVQLNINTDGGKINLTGYQKGTDSSDVSATDTVNQAISKLENKAAASKTVVEDGDNGGHVTVSSSAASDGHMVYTINENDIASENALNQEISDREAGDNALDARLGTGVTSANTATAQLTALSGNSASDTSATTSVEGAKRYTDAKVGAIETTIENLDAEKSTYSGSVKQFATYIKQENGQITGFSGRTVSASDVANDATNALISDESTVKDALDTLAEKIAANAVADKDGSINVTTTGATTELDVNIKSGEKVLAKDGNAGLYTDLDLVKITTGLPETVKERYQLLATDDSQIGVNIDVPKDSHIESITYITDSGDTHYQNLEYVYIDASGKTQTTYVDMSELVLETEFASGVTVTNHIAHGVVDSESEKNSNNDAFLTVGADGFKVSGIKDEIDAKINALEVTVDTAVTGMYVAAIQEKDGLVSVKERKNVSEAVLNNYSKGSDASGVAATDTVNAAIGKLENQIDAAKAAATTVVAEGTDAGNNMEIVPTTGADGHKTYTINLTDVASKTALDAETAARKAVDGQDGDTYAKNTGATYISNAENLNDADVKLDAAIKGIADNYLNNVVVNGVTGTVNNNVATVEIDGGDIKLSGYTDNETGVPTTADTVNVAISKLYNKSNSISSTNNGITVTTGATATTLKLNVSEATDATVGSASAKYAQAENGNAIELKSDGIFVSSNWDCGTY